MSAHPWSRRGLVLLVGGLVALALVQVTLVNFIPTPGAAPDLVVVAVLATAMARGPLTGGLVGAGAGLILDLIPPASGPLGGWMLVLAATGAVLGRVAETYQPGPFAAMLLLALGAGAVVLARGAVLWFAGSPLELSLLGAALASAAWALLLAPLALLAVNRPTRAAPPPLTPVRSAPGGLGHTSGAGVP